MSSHLYPFSTYELDRWASHLGSERCVFQGSDREQSGCVSCVPVTLPLRRTAGALDVSPHGQNVKKIV